MKIKGEWEMGNKHGLEVEQIATLENYYGKPLVNRMMTLDTTDNHEVKMVTNNMLVRVRREIRKYIAKINKMHDELRDVRKTIEYYEGLDIAPTETVNNLKQLQEGKREVIDIYEGIIANNWSMVRIFMSQLSGIMTDQEFAQLIGVKESRIVEARKDYEKEKKRNTDNFFEYAIVVARIEGEGEHDAFDSPLFEAFHQDMMKLYNENKLFRETVNEGMMQFMLDAGVRPFTVTTDGNGKITSVKEYYPEPKLVH
jgi:hypothetical protein